MQIQGRYLILITILFIIEDIILLNLLYIILFYVFGIHLNKTYQVVYILINLGYLLSFALIRVDFNDVKQLHIPHLIRRNLYKLAITAFIMVLCLFILKESSMVSRLFILTFFSSAFVLLTFSQWITRKALTFTIRKNINKGIILGAGLVGGRVYEEMLRNIYNGIIILGFFDDNPEQNDGDVLGNIEEAKEYILKNGITNVFCTLPLSAEEKIRDFIKFSESHEIGRASCRERV